jgi:hypothetical protein
MPEGFGPIADFDELVRSIASTLHRKDLVGEIPQWIASTELELFRDCNVRPGDQISTGTFVGGEAQLALPWGAIRPVALELTQASRKWVPQLVSINNLPTYLEETDGLVRAVAVFGDAIQLAPAPAAGTTYRLFYHGMPAPLSRQNRTTRLFEMGWDAYLYGALLRSAPWIGDDERIPTWGQFFGSAKASLKLSVWRSRTGGGLLTVKPDFQVMDRHTEESSI